MSNPFLEVDGIGVRFGGLLAVDGVTLAADCGELVGVIGPNGAGKTSLFNAVLGSGPRHAGRVRIGGHDVSTWPAHRRARAGLGRTFQRLEVFGSMSVRDNLLFATEAAALSEKPWRLLGGRGHQDPAAVDELLARLVLDDVAHEPVAALPLGLGRVVELGRALCARPRLLLLDEPSSGLDAAETAIVAGHLRWAARDRDVGVVLIEHDMSLVLGVCERLYVLDFGRLIASGATADVAASAVVRDAYLGDLV